MAQQTQRISKAQFYLAPESTRDTFEPVPSDGSGMFLAENIQWTPEGENYEPQYAIADGLKWRESSGMKSAAISFDILLKGSGTAGQPPDFAEALKACGFQEVVNPGVDVRYAPVLDFDGAGGNPDHSYSAALIEDGVLYALAGGFATWTLAAVTGQVGRLSISLQGAFVDVADVALRRGANQPSYDPTKAPPFVGANFVYDVEGATPPYPPAGERIGIQNFNVDGGNVVGMVEDANAQYGVVGARITDRKLTGSFDPEMRKVADKDFFGEWVAENPASIQTGNVGNPGNQWSIDIRRTSPRVPQLGDRNGIRILEYPFGVVSFATDEEGVSNEPEFLLTFS